MDGFVILVLSLASAAAAVVFLRLIGSFKFPVFGKRNCRPSIEHCVRGKSETLDCRVKLTKEQKDDSFQEVLSPEICGTIHAHDDCSSTIVKISIKDITDGTDKAKAVHTPIEKWQIKDSNIFCYIAKLGKLPEGITTLSDWMTVAEMPVDWLQLPLRGKRDLELRVSIQSQRDNEELACGVCYFTYENITLGYIELEEDIRRAKTTAVPLAFAVAAADKKISDCEIKVIENWSGNNITAVGTRDKIKRKLNELLSRFIALFPYYNQSRGLKMCRNIVKTVPLKVRYDILELCLRVVGSNGTATDNQIDLLKNVANRIGIYREKFRYMMEKVIPVNMYEAKDLEVSLGIASDMNTEQTCRQLSKEYRKWNSRVTNRNPKVKTQAERMLKLIADVRNQYVR